MNVKAVLLVLCSVVFGTCRSQTVRKYFSSCSRDGFVCHKVANSTNKFHVVYACPIETNDVLFHLWDFRAPTYAESFTIQHCTNLSISFGCTEARVPIITALLIENVENLRIVQTVYTHNPPTVVFENITNLEYIPEKAFVQITKQSVKWKCTTPPKDLENLFFTRVNIGTIAPNAFENLTEFYNFSWSEVHVRRLQHLAVQVQFNNAGNFSIRKSNLEVSEHLAFKIVGKRALFVDNKFVDVASSAINGTIDNFDFISNSVDNLESSAISIYSQNVKIKRNKFQCVRAGAFEKISPGLFEISHINIGKLKFAYDFSENDLHFLDAGSLNPDVSSYDNVASEFLFAKNSLLCSCENLGWLHCRIGHGYSSQLLQDFYDTILDEDYENVCSYTSCKLSLRKSGELISGGVCSKQITVEDLCLKNTTTTELSPFGSTLPTRGGFNLSEVTSRAHISPSTVTLPLGVFVFVGIFKILVVF